MSDHFEDVLDMVETIKAALGDLLNVNYPEIPESWKAKSPTEVEALLIWLSQLKNS